MVTEEQVKSGVTRYFEAECCEKSQGVGKFASYFMLPSVPKIVCEYMHKVKDSGLMPEIFHADGWIDIDEAEHRAREAMRKVDHIEMLGYRFNESDVGAIASYIKGA